MIFSSLFSNPLATGTKAPDFDTLDDTGLVVRLSELRGNNVLLVFYPGDGTSVCTAQLCEYRDHWEVARSRNVLIFGVNPASRKSHHGFREKFKLPFPLLVDPGRKISRAYRSNGLIVKRTVYLIGPEGKIRYARRGKPLVDEVLAAAGSWPS